MKRKRKQAPPETVRCSISFSAAAYRELERIAEEKRVSVAWVVRDALEQYLVARRELHR